MSSNDIKQNIKKAIHQFNNGSISENALNLFQTLGYNTGRQNPFTDKTFKFFKESFLDNDKSFNEEKALAKEWEYVDFLFQLSKEEISGTTSLFDTGRVDNAIIESYLFFVIELKNENYNRSVLSRITREVNRIFSMPVMLLFKYGNSLTVSVINRRLHKRDESKDVLEKVTLIKDINIQNPHRAHIEILFDLSFIELLRVHKFTNFVELHNAWQKTLDLKELNKQFYQKLFNWYLWALTQVKFPQIRPEKDKVEEKIHQSESLIRLLTRLLFVWFMKEKGLINPALFDVNKLRTILKDFEGINGNETIYYKAILQNLFFATLNKPIEQRKVIDKGFNPKEYGDPLVYRFDDLFREPKNFLSHFKNIPFLNGGLFECLDQKKDKDNPVEIRMDGFSTKKFKQAVLHDKLFFGEYKDIDLIRDYDDKKKNKLTIYGLIDILHQYKFTIEENTPIEEEIALDPELLGKVFENLLASYTPETQTPARKQTGSFYTPREIVNYMVDESLIAYLKQQFSACHSEQSECVQHDKDEQRLRDLLSYSENKPDFTSKEKGKLIKAIDNCKILDPACGSGAFPMGILQKMIHILHKLDPENKIWFNMVVSNFPVYMQEEVKKRLQKENWNYVRKLGIIQQCIYGVDIQPIATQIAKLRFFISLLVDQTEKPNEPNRGIDPLPNLDFKIVTANTLISAPESDVVKIGLFENQTDPFFEEFNRLTGQYFSASMPKDKKELKNKIAKLISEKCNEKIRQIESKYESIDERIREALKEKHKAFIDEKKREIKLWESYTNLFKYESVGFFEPRYFFPKVTEGFDVIIANPPYVEHKKLKGISSELKKIYSTYSGTADLYVYFYENGIKNLRENGTLVYITSNKFIKTSYGENLRKYFTNFKINEIIDFTEVHVFEALVASCIFSVSRRNNSNNKIKIAFANDSLLDFSDVTAFVDKNKFFLKQSNLSEKIWQLENETKLAFKEKIENGSVSMNKIGTINIYRGVTTGFNPAFIIDDEKRKELIKEDKVNKDIIKPLLQGRNIKKWVFASNNENLLFVPWHFPLNNDASISGSSEKAEKKLKAEYSALYKHLQKYKKELSERNKDETGIRYEWYSLQRCAASYYPEFEKEKIIWGLTADKWAFAYDNENHFLPSNGYILTSKEIPVKYLLALMNSKLMEFYFGFIGIMTAGGAFTLKHETVIEFPIKVSDEKTQNIFIKIVEAILSIKQNPQCGLDSTFFECLIDVMVYALYFRDEIKAADAEVLKHLTNLPELKDDWSDEKKLAVIEKIYKELSGPKHPVSIAMSKMQEIEEIKIIENEAGNNK